jgi:UMF1 family MFS transporter
MLWIWAFSAAYVIGAAGLWTLAPEAPALTQAVVLFCIGFVGMEFATTFTNALLPSLTGEDDIGAVSGSGFAFGYVGGVAALVLMLLFFAENGSMGRTLIGLPPAHALRRPLHGHLVRGLHDSLLPVGARAEAAAGHDPPDGRVDR